MSLSIPRTQLITRPPFSDLFPIEKAVLEAVAESIRADGFDWERPIMVWKNDRERVVVDGHTRLKAAGKARLKEVPIIARKFSDERAALEYAIAAQRDRRNMSREQQAAHVLRVVEALDKPQQGKRSDLSPSGGKLDSAKETAKKAGVSERQVERARRVKASGDEETKKAVREGKTTLAAAERKVKKSEPDMVSLAKRMDKEGKKELAKLIREQSVGPVPEAEPPADANAGDDALEDLWSLADDALDGLRCYENDFDNGPVRDALVSARDALEYLVEAAWSKLEAVGRES